MPEQTAVEHTFAEAKAERTGLSDPLDPAPLDPAPLDPARVQTVAILVLLALAVMYTLHFTREVLLPVFLAFLLSLLLRGPVKTLRRLHLPEPLGAALVTLALLATVGGLAYMLSEPATAWVRRLPVIVSEVREKFGDIQAQIEQARLATERLQQMTGAGDAPPEVVVRGPSLAAEILSQTQIVMAQAAVTLALTFFFLAFGRHTLESVLRSLPRVADRLHLVDIVNTVQINISAYLMTITLINSALAFVTATLLWALGMPNPILFGGIAGLLNFIPYIGSACTTIILAVVALLSFDTWWAVLLPPACFIMLTALEGNFVTPTIVGRRLTLNPIFVFATVLFWGWLWGMPGALLAVPILAVFKILCDATPPLRTLGALIGG
ncbi:AI-2E family transporter [Rhodocista pekingensis]|uniref:AI-2E family transporter n=1 Tax=Rhodocista pekingensis TaxID=201185 RepID=A0ABW2KV90_9PROT